MDQFMIAGSILCILSYLCISLVPNLVVGFIGCVLCGLSVGIMWPGVFSKAAASDVKGGTENSEILLYYLWSYQNEDIIQEIGKHSEYNMECEEVLPCRKKYGQSAMMTIYILKHIVLRESYSRFRIIFMITM